MVGVLAITAVPFPEFPIISWFFLIHIVNVCRYGTHVAALFVSNRTFVLMAYPPATVLVKAVVFSLTQYLFQALVLVIEPWVFGEGTRRLTFYFTEICLKCIFKEAIKALNHAFTVSSGVYNVA